jgi:hypothetical protein
MSYEEKNTEEIYTVEKPMVDLDQYSESSSLQNIANSGKRWASDAGMYAKKGLGKLRSAVTETGEFVGREGREVVGGVESTGKELYHSMKDVMCETGKDWCQITVVILFAVLVDSMVSGSNWHDPGLIGDLVVILIGLAVYNSFALFAARKGFIKSKVNNWYKFVIVLVAIRLIMRQDMTDPQWVTRMAYVLVGLVLYNLMMKS